ncbi:MAG: hypothetical protein IJY23_01515 [Clostridia bacterium]|nr:hypothetical protein [Clostridia bacterium]
MKYKLHLRYIYTFYNNGEASLEDVFDEFEKILPQPHRFTLHDQEDGTFILSELKNDFIGNYTTLTFPNKDNLVIHEGETVELAYDEYYSAMGDDNHNVYVGTITLIKE